MTKLSSIPPRLSYPRAIALPYANKALFLMDDVLWLCDDIVHSRSLIRVSAPNISVSSACATKDRAAYCYTDENGLTMLAVVSFYGSITPLNSSSPSSPILLWKRELPPDTIGLTFLDSDHVLLLVREQVTNSSANYVVSEMPLDSLSLQRFVDERLVRAYLSSQNEPYRCISGTYDVLSNCCHSGEVLLLVTERGGGCERLLHVTANGTKERSLPEELHVIRTFFWENGVLLVCDDHKTGTQFIYWPDCEKAYPLASLPERLQAARFTPAQNAIILSPDHQYLFFAADLPYGFAIRRLSLSGKLATFHRCAGICTGLACLNEDVLYSAMEGEALYLNNLRLFPAEKPRPMLHGIIAEGDYIGTPISVGEACLPIIVNLELTNELEPPIPCEDEMRQLAARGYTVITVRPTRAYDPVNEIKALCNDTIILIDECLRCYRANHSRIGIMGRGLSATLTLYLAILHADRFAAVAVEAPITSWFSFRYTSKDGKRVVNHYFDYESADHLIKHSLLTYANRINVPTLILHSEYDENVFLSESISLFSALKLSGIPTRLCVYSGEGHSLSQVTIKRRMEELTTWFGLYHREDKCHA